MTARTVVSQAELDQAVADKVDTIDIDSPKGVWLQIGALGNSSAVLWGNSSAVLWGNSSAVLWDNSSAVLWGNSSARLWGNSSAVLWGNSSAVLWGNSSARADAASTVHARGRSTVTAGSHVAVHLHSASVNLSGGVVIDHTKVDLTDPKAWCDYHGVEVKRGLATLYKAVNDDWSSPHGTSYAPGSKPSAADWRDTDECGYGLHFGPTVGHALAYHEKATRFLAVGVRLTELRPINDGGVPKAKAPKVARACVEVDRHGRGVTR